MQIYKFHTHALAGIFALILFITGCTNSLAMSSDKGIDPARPKPYKALGKWYQPLNEAKGFKQQGLASWYGKKFHGKKTANGETYDMHKPSAAHKTLPLGTWVRVYNIDNGKQADLRINDRGPFVRGRIIDLSYAAAKGLGVVGPGTARVKIEALGRRKPAVGNAPAEYVPINYDKGSFTFQVGAFKNHENALRLKNTLDAVFKNAHIRQFNGEGAMIYRVCVGRFTSLENARKYDQLLSDQGFEDAFILAE